MTADELRDMVLERLHADRDAWRGLVREVAAERPALRAGALEAGLRAAAEAIDSTISRGGASTDEARTARRLAARLAIEIDRTGGDPSMGELLASWREGDFFLSL
jgi:hypothetical protein